MNFVDTNYFLRFLLKDVEPQWKKAKNLFEKAALGKIELFTSLIVFFEIFWVLCSFYGKDKKEIGKILRDVLKMKFIKLEKRGILEKALEVYLMTSLELEDCYNLVYALQQEAVKLNSFDKKLKKEFNKTIAK